MKTIIIALAAAMCGFLAGGHTWEPSDASLTFGDDCVLLHIDNDTIVLPDNLAAELVFDINKHLLSKQ